MCVVFIFYSSPVNIFLTKCQVQVPEILEKKLITHLGRKFYIKIIISMHAWLGGGGESKYFERKNVDFYVVYT